MNSESTSELFYSRTAPDSNTQIKHENSVGYSHDIRMYPEESTHTCSITPNEFLVKLFPKNEYKKRDEEEFKKECDGYPYQPTILSARNKIVVIGDLHGDYNLTIECLKLGNVLDTNLEWIGGDTVVVQVGDQIDRCRPLNEYCDCPNATIRDEASDIKILKFFNKLHLMAIKCGGAVISLLGNHELMNVLGNMNYVSYKGLKEFEGYTDPNNPDLTFETGKKARIHAFSPGNEYAKLLGCSRLSSVIVGSFIFVHAGIIPKFMKKANITTRYDLYKINYGIRKWLLKHINKDYVSHIVNSFRYSMFWNRILGAIPPNVNNEDPDCIAYLDPVLKLLDLGGMIIGHTPQFFSNNDGINSTCGNKLWRVDVGGSDAFLKFDNQYNEHGKMMDIRKVQVLVITDDKKVNIIRANNI
jgi:hypothetical protein